MQVITRALRSARGIVVIMLGALSIDAAAADLTVVVQGIQDEAGEIMVGVFDSAAAFPAKTMQGQSIVASRRNASGSVRMVFAGLPPGTYAVSAFHDRDGNRKLTTNLMGMPTEPYGFSGQGKGSFGPPAFKDVAITVPDAGTAITIGIN